MGKRSQPLKYWAYLEQTGSAKINAYQVLEREKAQPGRWKQRTYYSTHSPDKRRTMHHRRSNAKTSSFVYNSSQPNDSDGGDGGESLNHYFFKIAISKLKRTTLKFSLNDTNFELPIEFESHDIEAKISHAGKDIYPDVLSTFTSPSPFCAKWDGKIAFEVCHKNPVDEKKASVYQAAGIAAVEKKVGRLLYRTPEASSTDHSEESYVNWLVPRLSEYMFVDVLSNPSSKADLIDQLRLTSLNERRLRESNARLLANEQRQTVLLKKLQSQIETLNHDNQGKEAKLSRIESMSLLQRLHFLITKHLPQ